MGGQEFMELKLHAPFVWQSGGLEAPLGRFNVERNLHAAEVAGGWIVEADAQRGVARRLLRYNEYS